jgi:hypothetical protein
MPEVTFQPIYPNPYIVGNPIRSREMFFGRVDEFRFIERALENGQKTALIVLFGERRSGKSSILYQILNGQLDAAFLPIFVDMQIMAGITDEAEFFGRIIADTAKMLGKNDLARSPHALQADAPNPTEAFRRFLRTLKESFPHRSILLLIDEYEILEAKIAEGCLSPNVLPFFAGLLETERISFVFTGSKRLEAHDQTLWGGELLQKATSRKISFLTKDDTARLITEPLAGKVTFSPEVISHIYTLTAGQPFYTQLICQNLVYHLNEVKKRRVESADLYAVVENILENPPPQMIFNWSEHSSERKLTLSLLAELSGEAGVFLSAGDISRGISKNKLEIDLSRAQLNSTLAELFQDEHVLQRDQKYSFRLDLFRRWIRHDHNIWQVKKEIGPQELARITKPARKKVAKRKKTITVLERILLLLFAAVAVYLGWQVYDLIIQKRVTIKANGGPFTLMVDGKTTGSTKGEKDSTRFVLKKKLAKGPHEFKAVLFSSNEIWSDRVDIEKDDQIVQPQFREFPLTVFTDAAIVSAKLGGLQAPSENQPASWQYKFKVTAGTHRLTVWDNQNDESKIDTLITVPANRDSIRIDFAHVVAITLQANYPFKYKFTWNNKKGNAELQAANSGSAILRGSKKGTYQFTFVNSQTGQEISKVNHIESDATIEIEFDPAWKSRQPQPGPEPREPRVHLVKINSKPDGADLLLNGIWRGATPFAENLKGGSYVIELMKAGYDTLKKGITITQPKDTTFLLIAQFGYVKVVVTNEQKTSISDAKVYIDGNFLGETPEVEEKVFEFQAGERQIKVERSGFETVLKTFLIHKNDTSKVPITLRGKRK